MERAPLVRVRMKSMDRLDDGSGTEDGRGHRAGGGGGSTFYRRLGAIQRLCSFGGGRPCCSSGVPPCSIVWTPIHPITWFAPFVGHMGATDSDGKLHDWGGGPIEPCAPAGMMFGAPCRYLPLKITDVAAWDAALNQSDVDYLEHMHCMLCGHDCHSHVAHALDLHEYWGCTWHNKIELAALVFFFGRHLGVSGFVATWLGTAIILAIVLAVKFAG